jgi:hypothetical protein
VDTNGQKPTWAILIAMTNPEMTEAALSDLVAQSVPTRVLLVLQGVDAGFRDRFLQIAEQESRLLVWSHDPALPSLSATWNRALQFVWGCGGTEALVVNNDVRLTNMTVKYLADVMHDQTALFVSAVGVTAEQFEQFYHEGQSDTAYTSKGGPDFSCYMTLLAYRWRIQYAQVTGSSRTRHKGCSN